MTIKVVGDTCVYLHTRSDGVVFYVGIGVKNRPYSEHGRNPHWHRTVEKYAYTITIIYDGLTWEDACALEIELIAKYRQISGSKLCNISMGGEWGTKGVYPSEETRAKMSVAKKNMSAETRAKLSAALKNKPPISEETRSKLSAAAKSRVRTPASEETRAKLSAAQKARPPISEEIRAKISAAKKNPSAETRAKMSAAKKNPSAETLAKRVVAFNATYLKKKAAQVVST